MAKTKGAVEKPETRIAKREQKKLKHAANKIIPRKEEKLEAFLEEFMRNGGNATQAAIVVLKPKTVESAAVLGNYYLKQAKTLSMVYLEKKGYGYGRMLDIAAEKMLEHKTPEWWDRLMKIAGYESPFFDRKPVGSGAPVVNIFQMHKKQQDEYGFAEEGEVVDDESEKA